MSQGNPTSVQINTYAENYVLYGDQSRAWRVAFPDSKAKDNVIHIRASIMNKMRRVQVRVEKIRSKLKKQTEEEFKITTSDLKKMLLTCVKKGIKDKIDAQGNTVAVSLSGAVAAITEVNRMDGNHAATKREFSGPNGVPLEPPRMIIQYVDADGKDTTAPDSDKDEENKE